MEMTDLEVELSQLRDKRNCECYSAINRGALWYQSLTEAQVEELRTWYNDWLVVTETKVIPSKPTWLE